MQNSLYRPRIVDEKHLSDPSLSAVLPGATPEKLVGDLETVTGQE